MKRPCALVRSVRDDYKGEKFGTVVTLAIVDADGKPVATCVDDDAAAHILAALNALAPTTSTAGAISKKRVRKEV